MAVLGVTIPSKTKAIQRFLHSIEHIFQLTALLTAHSPYALLRVVRASENAAGDYFFLISLSTLPAPLKLKVFNWGDSSDPEHVEGERAVNVRSFRVR